MALPISCAVYKAIIAYDGTHYFGWQKTQEGPSIQEEMEKAIFRLTGEKVLPEGTSRTDRGVHAEGQVVQITVEKDLGIRGMNAVLPEDIRVKELIREEFDIRKTKEKEYRYKICNERIQTPFQKKYAWHFFYELDFEKMRYASQSLLGTHDFSAFANEKEKNPVCTIFDIAIEKGEIRVRGDRFLYKMVRNLVGSLMYVGCGKIEDLGGILRAGDRKRAGVTAPAHGLFLQRVVF